MVLFLPFSSHALTSQTTKNHIQGSAPYLTFDGGRTRVVDANGLLGITLSNGVKYTPSTNYSSYSNPIELPIAGQSFTSIGMLVPTNTNSVALNTLIGSPYNYWRDDDGDSDVTATGSLYLFIADNNNRSVSRNTVLTACNNSAPYRITLSSTNGTLTTRYGVPNRRNFNASSVTYYINPKSGSSVCVKFARPNLTYGTGQYAGPASIWDPANGFLTQKTEPSSYGQNFPTTGLNGLFFDLLITGSSQALSWSPVSRGGITATMSYSTATSVRVTLTGPYATYSQQWSNNPGRLPTLTLPQTFELVGRDRQGNPVVKYGFTLKQWFVNRGFKGDTYANTLSWCNSIGYRMSTLKDLTNSNYSGARPSSPGNHYMRHIGSGFVTEWGRMDYYSGLGFDHDWSYWTSNLDSGRNRAVVKTRDGSYGWNFYADDYGLCAYP